MLRVRQRSLPRGNLQRRLEPLRRLLLQRQSVNLVCAEAMGRGVLLQDLADDGDALGERGAVELGKPRGGCAGLLEDLEVEQEGT